MLNKFFVTLSLCCLSLLSNAELHTTSQNKPQLIIIIDDIGNSYKLGKHIVDLPAPMTLAFLPHTPFAKKLAEESHLSGKENILHAPMENTSAAPLGPGALTQDMAQQDFVSTLNGSINAIPHIQGINNHMGSELTKLKEPMQWVMKELKQQQLYFIDSLTTPKSVGYQAAQQHQVPVIKRDVFLDNDVSEAALQKQWDKAIRIAERRGHAVLIGHPYQETSNFLKKALAKLEGIELKTASDFMLQRAWQAFASTDALPYNRYWLNHNNQRQGIAININNKKKQSSDDEQLISHASQLELR